MSSPEFRDGPPRARGSRHAARNLSHALAERERGKRRLNATTATVGFASVVAAGAVAAALPGSTHAAVTTTNRSSAGTRTVSGSSTSVSHAGATNTAKKKTSAGSAGSGSAGSNASNSSNSSNSSGNSNNLQAPAAAPVQSSGGGQATSGGTSSW